MKKKSTKEKIIILITILLAIVLYWKSFYYDPIDKSALNQVEIDFVEWVEVQCDNTFDSFMYKNGMLEVKIVEIKAFEDEETKEITYKSKIRKYILGYFPIGDDYVYDVEV